MKLPTRFLSRTGVVVAVSVALMGFSIAQGATLDAAGLPGAATDTTNARPSPQQPLEERIKQAIEELNRKAQAALEELGELDSPEKVARAEQILDHLEQSIRAVRKRAHNRVAERFDEVNDVAMARLHIQARADLQALGQLDTAEERQRAEEIRARIEKRREQIQDRRSQLRERLERRHRERGLPDVDFQQPRGRPPQHAPAYGLRLQLEELSPEEAEAAISRLEMEARASLERLGELDTPGKVHRAGKIRARLQERTEELQAKAASQVKVEELDRQLEGQVRRLRRRAESVIKDIGELDTPEKQQRAKAVQARIDDQIRQLKERLGDHPGNEAAGEFEEQAQELSRQAEAAIAELGELDDPQKEARAREIRARLEEQLLGLRGRLADPDHLTFQRRADREARVLRRRARAALERLGELDTPEKQEAARRIRERLADQIQELRERLARRAHPLYGEEFEQEVQELRRKAQAALSDLGRLDSPEKIARARQILARMKQDHHRLRRQQAERLRDQVDQLFGARAELLPDPAREVIQGRVRDRVNAALGDQPSGSGLPRNRTEPRQEHRPDRARQDEPPADPRDRPKSRTRRVTQPEDGVTHLGDQRESSVETDSRSGEEAGRRSNQD